MFFPTNKPCTKQDLLYVAIWYITPSKFCMNVFLQDIADDPVEVL
jgi:hypothetical protein